MPCCAVFSCSNHGKKTKGQGIIYHSFPKDVNLRKAWIVKCKRLDKLNVAHARICSNHFNPSDYEDDIRNRLLGLEERKKLKPTAIPSSNLTINEADEKHDTSARNERKRKRTVLKHALDRLESLDAKKIRQSEGVEFDVRKVNVMSEVNKCSVCENLKKENEVLQEKVISLEKEISRTNKEKDNTLKIKNTILMKKQLRLRKVISENRDLRKKFKDAERKNTQISTIQERIKSVLTSTQLTAIIEKKCNVK